VKRGKLLEDAIELPPLTNAQSTAKQFLFVIAAADEILSNLNSVLLDLDRLTDNPRAFEDRDPWMRYKILFRFFFYEFGRFEDVFAYAMLWLQMRKRLTKPQRKALKDAFFQQIEPMVKIRNTLIHDHTNWSNHMTWGIAILQGTSLFGASTQLPDTATTAAWKQVLGPICQEKRHLFYRAASEMRTFWNMLIAEQTYWLVQAGDL
jgi:hypothetical protein